MRRPGPTEFVDIGCSVYSRLRTRATSIDEAPVGGLVVAITEDADPTTGEVRRAFLTVDHHYTRPYIHWDTVSEDEVDRELIVIEDARVLTSLARRLAEDIAFTRPGKQRRGAATTGEVRNTRAMLELYGVMFGQTGELHAELTPLRPAQPAAPRPRLAAAPGHWFTD